MVRHAPIHRRSGHSDIAICCGRNVRGSSPSTSVVPLSNQVTTLNHKRFKGFKMFSDGHSDFDGLTPVRHTVGDTCRPAAVWSCVMLTEATLGGVRPTGLRWGQSPNLPSGILCRLPRTADNTAAEAMCEKCPPATWKRLSCRSMQMLLRRGAPRQSDAIKSSAYTKRTSAFARWEVTVSSMAKSGWATHLRLVRSRTRP